MRLMPHWNDWPLWIESLSLGPNIISTGHHQRSTACCTMSFCACVPFIIERSASKPCRWWNDSSLQMRIIARAYGPYVQRQSGIWFMIAAPSTSQPITPTSAQVGVV
ncbi:hypothetical protein AWB65_06938 [Caballeronia humi]|uniref:Uncharacterized protein n=1 Tax=Caballeronia humi TaxID=326474 RepID=A0A158JPC9_9BURK|nr:hypothetical protein AWB65_06938 [Caballeronia humi]